AAVDPSGGELKPTAPSGSRTATRRPSTTARASLAVLQAIAVHQPASVRRISAPSGDHIARVVQPAAAILLPLGATARHCKASPRSTLAIWVPAPSMTSTEPSEPPAASTDWPAARATTGSSRLVCQAN